MEIFIKEIDWAATVLLTPQDADVLHCVAFVNGRTAESALKGADKVLNLFAKGREAYLRVEPESYSEVDSNTKELKHAGFVRFSFRKEPGRWHLPDKSHESGIQFVGFSAAEAR
jgi:hypothetical protein